ncbi:hypothetical protein B0H13DRAFT_1870799 [Mycena leptocephala]|nr:hypothetical protein B0H13DRAFT_1870799 [Mycena leptocephala]
MSLTEKEFEFWKLMEHIRSTIDTVRDISVFVHQPLEPPRGRFPWLQWLMHKHSIEAAVRELDRVNELLHMLDPEEPSRSSSLVSHAQDLLNLVNISNEVDDQRHEKDQVSELEVPHAEATTTVNTTCIYWS